jgi:hypothetical protein
MKSGPTTRVKKSFSISRESEQFIRRVRTTRKIGSDSQALDQILREALATQTRAGLDAAYKTYYDSASESDLADESAWAEFGTQQLAELSK